MLYHNKIIYGPINLYIYIKFIFIFSSENVPSLGFKFKYIDDYK